MTWPAQVAAVLRAGGRVSAVFLSMFAAVVLIAGLAIAGPWVGTASFPAWPMGAVLPFAAPMVTVMAVGLHPPRRPDAFWRALPIASSAVAAALLVTCVAAVAIAAATAALVVVVTPLPADAAWRTVGAGALALLCTVLGIMAAATATWGTGGAQRAVGALPMTLAFMLPFQLALWTFSGDDGPGWRARPLGLAVFAGAAVVAGTCVVLAYRDRLVTLRARVAATVVGIAAAAVAAPVAMSGIGAPGVTTAPHRAPLQLPLREGAVARRGADVVTLVELPTDGPVFARVRRTRVGVAGWPTFGDRDATAFRLALRRNGEAVRLYAVPDHDMGAMFFGLSRDVTTWALHPAPDQPIPLETLVAGAMLVVDEAPAADAPYTLPRSVR